MEDHLILDCARLEVVRQFFSGLKQCQSCFLKRQVSQLGFVHCLMNEEDRLLFLPQFPNQNGTYGMVEHRQIQEQWFPRIGN